MSAVTACSEKLRHFIGQIDSGNITGNQLCEFVKLSRAIIQAHLTFNRSSITPLCLRQGITVTDLAYDCIAEAFAKDAEGRFYKIHNFVDALEAPLDAVTDQGLFLAYKGFLLRFAEAQLARLYAQMDPSGSHIHRNVRDALKDSRRFVLRRDFRGLVIVPREIDALDNLGPFPQEELGRAFLPEISPRDNIPAMLEALHRVLAAQSKFRRSLPLIEFVVLVKDLLQSEYDPEQSVDQSWSLDGLQEEDLYRLRLDVENVLKEKILLTYLVRGKITDKQARGMFDALSDTLREWFAGNGTPNSLHAGLNHYLPMDADGYEEEFRPKMEYLLKIARQEIAARLMGEL